MSLAEMDPEAFEQLVSEWLDQPSRDDLRAAIEAAVAESPALARVKDEWLRLDRLVRSAGAGVDDVDWRRLRQRIMARLEAGGTGAGLDERLRDLTQVEQRVDWRHLRQRISGAVGGTGGRPSVMHRRLGRVAASIVLLAAAAALVFMFTLPVKSPVAENGFARVHISTARSVGQSHDGNRAFARVSVSAPPEADEPPDTAAAPGPHAAEPQLTEVFLMIEPVHVAAGTGRGLIPFGFN